MATFQSGTAGPLIFGLTVSNSAHVFKRRTPLVYALQPSTSASRDYGLAGGEAVSFRKRQPIQTLDWSQQELEDRTSAFKDLLALETIELARDVLRRRPEVLMLEPNTVVVRLLKLKELLPGANLPGIVVLQPSLLLLEDLDDSVGPAIRKLRALMPGIPVESKLHEGGAVWWSFIEGIVERVEQLDLAELLALERVHFSRERYTWPHLLGQDARVAKHYLEHKTGRTVELISVSEMPNVMYNMVPNAFRRLAAVERLSELKAALGRIVVVYNPRTGKVAISPRLV